MRGATRISVLIADDHPLVRVGLESLLQREPDMEVVALAADGNEAVQLAERTLPDVVLLDVRMPVKDGLTALVEIVRQLPRARCLMLTGFHQADLLLRAVMLGAAGCLLKHGETDSLLRAIRAVHHGGGALDPATTQQLMSAYLTRQTLEHTDHRLTPAELRVLSLLGQGLSNQALATALGVSERTVNTHVRHILDKLAVKNRVQAALYASARGLTA